MLTVAAASDAYKARSRNAATLEGGRELRRQIRREFNARGVSRDCSSDVITWLLKRIPG